MEDFELPVVYKGVERSFKSAFIQSAYSYKIQVDVEGIFVIFEPDEERNFRAVIDPNTEGKNNADVELLKAIADAIEKNVK